MASVRTIPLSSPWLDERETELVSEVLGSGRLSLGPTIDRFEEAFAEVVGAPYAAAVSSGTAGLHLLCIAPESAPATRSSRPRIPSSRRRTARSTKGRRRCSPTSTRER